MKTQAIVLAAGKGTRMKSVDVNKCLMPINGKPMIRYPIEALAKLGVSKPIVVVGFAAESIRNELGESVIYAVQKEANGTAKALETGAAILTDDVEEVIVLYGDHSAFYDQKVLSELINKHRESNAGATLVTVVMDNPFGYGRIVRNAEGVISEIVEEKNATDSQRQINEINTGNAVYSASFLRKLLPQIQANELTQEYYLTDIVKLGLEQGYKIETYTSYDKGLSMGVNTPEQLQEATDYMRQKRGATS